MEITGELIQIRNNRLALKGHFQKKIWPQQISWQK
jgi:hypothetical protein